MFKANTSHLQQEFFSAVNLLSKEKKAKLMASAQWQFYLLIFCQIDESLFAPLSSEKGSRPNAPANAMVSALILKHHFGWTYQELFEQMDVNLLTRTALGLSDLDSPPSPHRRCLTFNSAYSNITFRLERTCSRWSLTS